MTIKLSLLSAVLVSAFLSACGGGGDTPPLDERVWVKFNYEGPTVVSKTDLVLGSGAEAVAGKTVTVHLSRWAYSASAPEFKDLLSSIPPLRNYMMKLEVRPEPGLADAVVGMKVGGKRTAVIPGDMSPGSWISRLAMPAPRMPPMVAEIELVAVE